MAVADQTKSIPALLEQLFLTQLIKSVTLSSAVSVTIPSVTGGVANTSTAFSATATVTGAKVGDQLLVTPVVALPTNCVFTGAYVSATDTVTFTFTSSVAGAVTGAAKTFDVTVFHRS